MDAQSDSATAEIGPNDVVAMAHSLFETLPVEIVEKVLFRGNPFDRIAFRFVCGLWATIITPDRCLPLRPLPRSEATSYAHDVGWGESAHWDGDRGESEVGSERGHERDVSASDEAHSAHGERRRAATMRTSGRERSLADPQAMCSGTLIWWSTEYCVTATKRGHLALLRWGIANGAPCDARVVSAVAAEGHLDVLK